MSSTIKLKRGRNVVVRNSFTNAERVSEYSLGADGVLNYNRIKMSEHGNDFIFFEFEFISCVLQEQIIVIKYKINFFFLMRFRFSTALRTDDVHTLPIVTGRPRPYSEPNTFSCHVSTGRGRHERRRPYGRKKRNI